MDKQYQELVAGRIYFGGASDIPMIADLEQIDVVVDLREESTGCASDQPGLTWQRIPLGDHADQPQAALFKDAIQAVVTAYHAGQKVAFHCGGGKGRTGAVAVGVLLELGLCRTLQEAEVMAKAIRPVVSLKPNQRNTLASLYPGL